jgi:polysaccharide export outer membrane protein
MRSAVLAVALVAANAGCLGMKLQEGAVRERARKADPAEPGVEAVTPAVVARLVEEAAREVSRPRPDPLAGEVERYDYRIAPFDVLGVTVWDHPELTIPAGEFRTPESTGNPVRSDGTMFYPHAGLLRVAGLTVSQVQELLTERLAPRIKNPQLDVRVVQFRGRRIQVTGEVQAPTTLPITDVPLRVQDAIALAKGFTPEADLSRVTLARGGKVLELDLQALYERGDASQNWLLQGDDVLNVPDRNRNKVFVLGEVKKPRALLMAKGRMTLAEAVAETEGIDQATFGDVVYVVRGAFDRPRVYRLDASSPDALLLAVQFPLKPADVVFVSASDLTRWNRVVSQVLPTIQTLWSLYDISYRTRLTP